MKNLDLINQDKVGRKSYDYQPNMWGDVFITYTPHMQKSEEWIKERVEEHKDQVRRMFDSPMTVSEMMTFVDTIQHLGIAYHFEKEIDGMLTHLNSVGFESNVLHEVALCFRLLRQHGFRVPADEFLKFKENKGCFKETLSNDVRGLLSLYNAAYLGFPGEDILDEAASFARDHLKVKVDNLETCIKSQVSRSLQIPLPRMMKRLEARWFIDEYGKDEAQNVVLMELAKLDFNLLQILHCEELKTLSLWWKKLKLKEELPYARDRLVECYFWVVGMYFEPQFSRARVMMTKFFYFIIFLDDTYDVYATYDECETLTDAIQKWDVRAADMLPEYLRDYYVKLVNMPKEIEAELEPSEKYRAFYIAEWFKLLAKAYFQETQLYAKGYTPPFKERLEGAIESSAVDMIACVCMIGMGEVVTDEAFLWFNSKIDVVRACAEFVRFIDDVVGYEREHEVGQVPSMIDCYMKEYNTTKEETILKFNSFKEDAWKRINAACLEPTTFPLVLIEPTINLAKYTDVMYNYMGDAFTKGDNLKEYVELLFLKPVSL